MDKNEVPNNTYRAAQRYATLQQLFLKLGSNFSPVFPATVIQSIHDGRTGASLESILAQFNNVFLPYQGTSQATRNLIPIEMRRKGITISYINMDGDSVCERAIAVHRKDTEYWGRNSNWTRIDELSLSGAIAVSTAGTWVINGNDTGISAVGPKGDNGQPIELRRGENAIEWKYTDESDDDYRIAALFSDITWTFNSLTAEQRATLIPHLSDFTAEEIAELQSPANDMIAVLQATNKTVTDAENVRISNENSRISNENSRISVESKRVAAEAARVTAENNRVTAEDTRVSSEEKRVTAENSRATAEAARVTAENNRVTAEDTRVSSEEKRVTAENSRVNAEAARVTAENTRETNEATRKTNEETRQSNEATRIQNESTRNANEDKRVQNETVRTENEAARITAESERIQAETNRESAEVEREKVKDAALVATSKANDATSRATEATIKANTAASNANSVIEEATKAKDECNDATSAANNATQAAAEKVEQIEEAMKQLTYDTPVTPVKLTLSAPEVISTKCKVAKRISAQLLPSYTLQNIIYQREEGNSLKCNPNGELSIKSEGNTTFFVIATQNTALWQEVTIRVRSPRVRLTSSGKLRLNNGKIRIV